MLKYSISLTNLIHPVLVRQLLEGDRLPAGPGGAHRLVDVQLIPLSDLGLNLGNAIFVSAGAGSERREENADSKAEEVQHVEGHRYRDDEDHEDPEIDHKSYRVCFQDPIT